MPGQLAYHARNFARFYDWTYACHVQDIPFYLRLATRAGSPLLELACGTGRLTIPLARAGFEVVGLDLSEEMLRIARAKLKQESPEVRRRVRLLHGDMTGFRVERPARLAFVPFSSIFHLHTREQRQACVGCAYEALAPGGLFLVDVLPPRVMEKQTVTGDTVELACRVNPATGKLTRELHCRLSQDNTARCTTCEHTYVEAQPNGRERRFVFTERYIWTTEEELHDLFASVGFRNVHTCGGYGLRPYTPRSYRMIVLGER